MNDEINKILDSIKYHIEEDDWFEIEGRFLKPLLDYITNLQQKIKHYEETTTFGDYVKEVNLLVDYKLRIEKAVEYINNCPEYLWANVNTKELLNILNGKE